MRVVALGVLEPRGRWQPGCDEIQGAEPRKGVGVLKLVRFNVSVPGLSLVLDKAGAQEATSYFIFMFHSSHPFFPAGKIIAHVHRAQSRGFLRGSLR